MTFWVSERGSYHESDRPANAELSRIAASLAGAAIASMQNKGHRVQFEPERIANHLRKDGPAWGKIGEAMHLHCTVDGKRRLEMDKRRTAAAAYMREYRARKKRQLHAPSDEGSVEKAKAAAYMREYRARKKREWDASNSESGAKKIESAKSPKGLSVPNGEQLTRPVAAIENLTTNETQPFGENKIYSKHEQQLLVKQELDDDQMSINSFSNQRNNDDDDDNEDLDEETDRREEKLNESILTRIEHQQLENLNYSTAADRTKLERSYLLECPAESLQHFLREDKETMTLSSTQPENSSNSRDECSVYGEHVANELRYMPFRTRTIVKHIINNAIFNAHMGKYDREQSAEGLLVDDQFRAE